MDDDKLEPRENIEPLEGIQIRKKDAELVKKIKPNESEEDMDKLNPQLQKCLLGFLKNLLNKDRYGVNYFDL